MTSKAARFITQLMAGIAERDARIAELEKESIQDTKAINDLLASIHELKAQQQSVGVADELEAQAGDGTSSNKYRAELYDEVWQAAREMGYGNVTGALRELAALKAQQLSAGVVDERAAFGRHFKSVGSLTVNQLAHARDTDGMPFYEHLPTRIAWSAWQARARLNPSPTGSGVVLPDRKMFSEYDPHPEYPSGWNDCLDEVERLNPCRAQAVPEGYVVVPVEPTAEMINAAHKTAAAMSQADPDDIERAIWNNMLAAAPSAKKESE